MLKSKDLRKTDNLVLKTGFRPKKKKLQKRSGEHRKIKDHISSFGYCVVVNSTV